MYQVKNSNLSLTMNKTEVANFTSSMMSLDEILASFGFDAYKVAMVTFILPGINLIGIVFCTLSAIIFFRKKFVHSSFFYYRLLCIVYIVHLAHNIPRGLVCFSPKYFPQMNSYWSAVYQIYYGFTSALLFHFEDTIQMGILLDRIRVFSGFVKRNFTSSPKTVSLAFFVTCFFINLPFTFNFKVTSFGAYFYFDSHGTMQSNTFYYYYTSDFSGTFFGSLFVAFTFLFLNMFLSLFVGIILNIVSVYVYHSYIKQRKIEDETLRVAWVSNSEDMVNSRVSTLPRQFLTLREVNERKIERNLFFMALTLCSISILSRSVFLFSYILSFFLTASTNLLAFTITFSIYTLVPTVAVFVFYSFNKNFRQEFKRKFLYRNASKKIGCGCGLAIRNFYLKINLFIRR